MIAKLFFCLPVRRNLFLKIPTLFRLNFSILAESNVSNGNATSENLFLHFVTIRFNISSADAAKMLKRAPSLERLKTLGNIEKLVSIVNRHGCNEDEIANIIRSDPRLMLISAERLVDPRIQALKDSGIESKIITRFPGILKSKLENLRSTLELLKTVFPTQDILIRAIRRNPYILRKNLQNLKLSVAFWEDFGIR
ncbi:hypothetical protein SUGI_0651130 [Cryptomeria japonica]|uniref:uncharacterized protein LOC131035690 n=1 Tax=Cryptomeria japonica TaxID=3369 RepID=UPI002414C20E|nr:uncharacterized protein LOC131035690 [Cryptomeria japonica]GLJ32353.1 hypothetical protein SUGI_0651130 [Cryptomeria japonica]